MMKFDGKVLIIGYGSVARCTLPILLEHVRIPLGNITVIDFENKVSALMEWTSQGIGYQQLRITPDNIDSVLSEHLSPGGLLIDLSWNLDTCTLLKWCHEHDVLFVNTSLEVWDSVARDRIQRSGREIALQQTDTPAGNDQGLGCRSDLGHRPWCQSRSDIPLRETSPHRHFRESDRRK